MNTIDQYGIIDIYRTPHLGIPEYMAFLRAYGGP